MNIIEVAKKADERNKAFRRNGDSRRKYYMSPCEGAYIEVYRDSHYEGKAHFSCEDIMAEDWEIVE